MIFIKIRKEPLEHNNQLWSKEIREKVNRLRK
jgi:hypothetical protein